MARESLARRGLQFVTVLLFVLVCLVHSLALPWLLLIPRYRREWIAMYVGPVPWFWYTNGLWLRPKVRVVGKENLPTERKGYIYAANHESLADIPVLLDLLRRPFLMKRGVLLSPIGWGAYLAGCVAFDRSSKESRKRALEETLRMATESLSVIVFPEGTFGYRDGGLREPKLNLLRHAYDRGLSVVPIGHAGTRRIVDHQSLPVTPGAEVAVVARAALSPADFPDRDAFAEACWSGVTDAVSVARREVAPGWPYNTAEISSAAGEDNSGMAMVAAR